MDISSLSYDELTYELGIRNVALSSTLLEKREILRLVLIQEVDLKLPAGKSNTFNFSMELSACSKKINEVDEEIQNMNSENMHIKYKEIITRLCHVENRLRRITAQDQTSDRSLQLLKQLCLASIELMENAFEIIKVTQIIKNENYFDHLLANVSAKASNTNWIEKVPTSGDVLSTIRAPTSTGDNPISLQDCPKYTEFQNVPLIFNPDLSITRRPNMENWSICYNGTTNVGDFQNIMETLRLMHNVSKEQLFATAATFFKEDALLWYRSIKHVLRDWDCLISELGRHFSTNYNDDNIWKHIYMRYQNQNEKLIFYVSSVEHLLQRLACIPNEQERVNIIKRNLLAPIKAALIFHEISSVDQLLKIGRSVEKCYWSENQYRF